MAREQTGIDFGHEVRVGGVTRLELLDDDEGGKATVGGWVTAEAGPHQGMETRPAGARR
ncbi:hypothetical protein EN939_00180 [Mesorhizobium sp. M7A.F.Ca.CA.002.05.1.1]|uniref:hypothetical protein n=1 Tax=Mesorhizobium sp. M7A.F.Ca.CA.002.05.1.1 TaxID=2496704 RepID=UPI000FCC1551|nr:hypothetical protein [Mesorhizobium sp. M7A.F.Ca.CA.002.05.1.1]RVA20258.1 hypothetical protein EN939_00180 [Mesorhizobium sp. M7A.F.Ca.CA.002.05.1.1]